MTDNAGGDNAVSRHRDLERRARIVAARRRGECYTRIAVREGVSWQRIQQICWDAGLVRPDPFGKLFYERRREAAATWREIAEDATSGWRPHISAARRAGEARLAALRHARAHGLPWPLPNRAALERATRRAERAAKRAERAARRDEKGLAEVHEIVERERRVLALRDALPKDRTISKDEAERFLVELYRTGMSFSHIAERTNCSWSYAKAVVRRLAPELIRPQAPRGKKVRHVGPLLDLRALREAWRAEEHRRLRDEQDARMLAAYLAGDSLRDISRREIIPAVRAWERISAASPELLPRPGPIARGSGRSR